MVKTDLSEIERITRRQERHFAQAKELIETINHGSSLCRGIYLGFMAFTAFLLIIISTTNDYSLLVLTPIKLPLFNIDVDLIGFYRYSPWAYFLVHVNLLMTIALLTRKLAIFHSKLSIQPFETRELLRAKLHIFAPIQYLSKQQAGVVRFILWIICKVLLVLMPPFILLLIQIDSLAMQDQTTVWSQRLALVADLIFSLYLWRRLLRGRARTLAEIRLPGGRRPSTKRDKGNILKTAFLYLFILSISFFGATIPYSSLEKAATLVNTINSNETSNHITRNCDFTEKSAIENYSAHCSNFIKRLFFDCSPIFHERITSILCWFPGSRWLDELPSQVPSGILSSNDLTAEVQSRIRQGQLEDLVRFNKKVEYQIKKDAEFVPVKQKRKSLSDDKAQELSNQIIGISLKGRSLIMANFSGLEMPLAQLQESRLVKANFENTKLHGANINLAQLYGARMNFAEMNGATLEWSNLNYVQARNSKMLGKINLTGADLSYADLSFADLRRAKLESATLSNAIMIGANLRKANLRRSISAGTNFLSAKLDRANFTSAYMRGALFETAWMRGIDLTWAKMQGAVLTGADMQGAKLSAAYMQTTHLASVNLQGADISGAHLQHAYIGGKSQLQGADLTGAELQGATLTDANFEGALFAGVRVGQNWPIRDALSDQIQADELLKDRVKKRIYSKLDAEPAAVASAYRFSGPCIVRYNIGEESALEKIMESCAQSKTGDLKSLVEEYSSLHSIRDAKIQQGMTYGSTSLYDFTKPILEKLREITKKINFEQKFKIRAEVLCLYVDRNLQYINYLTLGGPISSLVSPNECPLSDEKAKIWLSSSNGEYLRNSTIEIAKKLVPYILKGDVPGWSEKCKKLGSPNYDKISWSLSNEECVDRVIKEIDRAADSVLKVTRLDGAILEH